MAANDPVARHSLLERLSDPAPLLAVEVRPPRADLSTTDSREAWIDANHALRRLAEVQTVVFVTDGAVGRSEEENLQHLEANAGPGVEAQRLVPFLTCKHSLEYCLWYAQRAAQSGYRALVVLGGDSQNGTPRCVLHAYELRRIIREKVPWLALGGWANPHRDPIAQVGYLIDGKISADFYLTQVVSHFDLQAVEKFLDESERRGLTLPGIFGVFYYRSLNRRTFRQLSQFIPVPVEGLGREFGEGATPEEICARTIKALRRLGVGRVYVSNLPTLEAHRVMGRIRRMVAD